MKTTLLLAFASLLAFIPTSQAASTCACVKTVHIHEIHRTTLAPSQTHKPETAAPVSEGSLFRSHAELETLNPG